MPNTYNSFNILINGITESTDVKIFKDANEALDSLYEIYTESVNNLIEHKAAAYLENLVLENSLFESSTEDNVINESMEKRTMEVEENLNDCVQKLQEWTETLSNSLNESDNSWEHCVITSKLISDKLADNYKSEDLLKVIKESLIDYKGISLNNVGVNSTNIIEEGDKIMKNNRVSSLISKKETALNEFMSIAESVELVNEVNEFKQSIVDLKVKIYDNDGTVTQEAYEMLMDLDVLEEGLRDKIKAAGEKRIDKKIAKKEAQIEKIKARMEKEKADFPEEIKEYEEDLKKCEEKGDEKGAAKIRKRLEREKDNHAFDIEEMEEDIRIIEGEIEKLKGKRKAEPAEVTQESYLSVVFDEEVLEESTEEVLEEGLKDKIAAIKDKGVAKKIAKKEAQIEKLRARMEKNGEGDPDNEELKEDIEIIKGEIEKLKEKIKKDGGECTQESLAILENLDVLEEGLKEKFEAKMAGVKDKRVSKKIAKKVIQIEKIKGKMEKEKEEHEANMAEYKEDLKACEEKGDEKGAEKIRKRMAKDEEGFKFYMEEMEEDIKIIEGEIEKLKGKVKEAGGEMTQEAYAILESLDVLEEGLKEKMAAKMSGIKDKRVAKKIAKKEAQIEKIRARMEKEKDFHKNYVEELEADIDYCREKGDEKGIAKIQKKLEKEKNEHAGDIEEMEEDIRIIGEEIAKLKAKVKESDGEMTQEAFEILMDLDVLEEGLKAKVKQIGDKRLSKKLEKRENLLGKMKQMLLDVQDEEHKVKIQSDITDLEADIEKIRAKMEKNIDEVVQESYLEVTFEYNVFDEIDEYDYLDEGLRQKIRDMKENGLNNKINKKEAKLAEKKIELGEMETPEDEKKKAKIEKEIEKLEKEIERLKGKLKSEPGDNIVEGEHVNESFDIEFVELAILESNMEELEAKLESKQQVLNESYSYRNEVEIEVLEEGLKEIKAKVGEKIDNLNQKMYDHMKKGYKSETALRKHIENIKVNIETAETIMKEKEGEGKIQKVAKCIARTVSLLIPGVGAVLNSMPTNISSNKQLQRVIKFSNMGIKAAEKRIKELENLKNPPAEEPAQESVNPKETFMKALDDIDFED